MKTILVDAVHCFVVKNEAKIEIFQEMYSLLEKYPNRKITLTGANDEEVEKFGLEDVPYELFTLKHSPEKTNPEYYQIMLANFNLKPDEVIYFEHSIDAVKSAEAVGIKTYFYDNDKKDLVSLKNFIDENL
jgi:HAD superfamily hydrolase (TIGR01509 family)